MDSRSVARREAGGGEMICPRCEGTGKIASPVEMRILRLSKGLSMGKVAKKMGVSAPFLSDLERGNRSWNAKNELRFRNAIRELSLVNTTTTA